MFPSPSRSPPSRSQVKMLRQVSGNYKRTFRDKTENTSQPTMSHCPVKARYTHRRSRAQQRNLVRELEKRVQECQRLCKEANKQVQEATLSVANENAKLQILLALMGDPKAEINGFMTNIKLAGSEKDFTTLPAIISTKTASPVLVGEVRWSNNFDYQNPRLTKHHEPQPTPNQIPHFNTSFSISKQYQRLRAQTLLPTKLHTSW